MNLTFHANLGSQEHPAVRTVEVLGTLPNLPAFVLARDAESGQLWTLHRGRLSREAVTNEDRKPSEA